MKEGWNGIVHEGSRYAIEGWDGIVHEGWGLIEQDFGY